MHHSASGFVDRDAALSARPVVPRLLLPHSQSGPHPAVAEERLSWPLTDASGSESTPCHSFDRSSWPTRCSEGASLGTEPSSTFWLGAASTLVTPCLSIERDYSAAWNNRQPVESATALKGGSQVDEPARLLAAATPERSAQQHAAREELLAIPRFAQLFLHAEDENTNLRKALSEEKQRVRDLQAAEQNQRQIWTDELTKIETELSRNQAVSGQGDLEAELKRAYKSLGVASSKLRSLRELLALFVTHVHDPLGDLRVACEELLPEAGAAGKARCPEVPSRVTPGAVDSEYSERLVRIVELLKFYAKTRRDWCEHRKDGSAKQCGQAERGHAELQIDESFMTQWRKSLRYT